MSKINYNKLKVDGLKTILHQITEASQKLGIDFFIIGAIARNIHLTKHELTPSGTKDIDIAILLDADSKYLTMKELLIREYGYIENTGNPFNLLTKDQKEVDLLPFKEIGEDIHRLEIQGRGTENIQLDGILESYKAGLEEVFIEEDRYFTCTIPAIIILKLIAYDDRPEIRTQDVNDIKAFMKYYPDIEADHIFQHHFDLYDGDREHQDVAMIVLGREMKKITQLNSDLHQRILDILEKGIDGNSKLAPLLVRGEQTQSVEQAIALLTCIRQGLEDVITLD